jgi:tetratricopeptide (TPR) repeat protein
MIANSVITYGASDERTLTSQSNLAKCLKAQGGKAKLSESLRLERSIFKICKHTMAPESPKLIDALAAIGRTLFFCGQYEKAAQYDRKVLALTKRRFQEESAELARAANNLAFDLARLNRAAEAEVLTRRALRATILVFGHGSKDHKLMVRNLETVLDDQSKVSEKMKVRTMGMTCGA